MPILISDKVDFKPKNNYHKEAHSIKIKGSTHQKDIVIFKVCTPNNRKLEVFSFPLAIFQEVGLLDHMVIFRS